MFNLFFKGDKLIKSQIGQPQIFQNWRWTLVFSIWVGFSNRGKGLMWLNHPEICGKYERFMGTTDGKWMDKYMGIYIFTCPFLFATLEFNYFIGNIWASWWFIVPMWSILLRDPLTIWDPLLIVSIDFTPMGLTDVYLFLMDFLRVSVDCSWLVMAGEGKCTYRHEKS